MWVVLASDHAGFELKEKIKAWFARKHKLTDVGCYSKKGVDYPDYAEKAMRFLASKNADRAVLVCGTGVGMSIAANKFRGVRAALCWSKKIAQQAREHVDANVLVLPGFLNTREANEIVEVFLKTPFSGEERHARRVKKITRLELKQGCLNALN